LLATPKAPQPWEHANLSGLILPPATVARLRAIVREGGPCVAALGGAGRVSLVEALRRADGRFGLAQADRLDQRLRQIIGAPPSDAQRRAAIAGLALGLAASPGLAPLPSSLARLRPEAVGFLADYLAAAPEYDLDSYAKDVRFVTGMAVPAGAQTVDVFFPTGLVARARGFARFGHMVGRLVLADDLAGAARLVRAHGWRPWLEIHTDQRRLAEFNEVGWDRCFCRLADLVALRHDVAGLWGASWFYDPQLSAISPRLAYLRARPLERGAIMVRLGPGHIHTQRAGQTSPRRKALIDSGRYRPVCYAMFWPRRELLAWAADQAETATMGQHARRRRLEAADPSGMRRAA
jgi:hypothetical protein